MVGLRTSAVPFQDSTSSTSNHGFFHSMDIASQALPLPWLLEESTAMDQQQQQQHHRWLSLEDSDSAATMSLSILQRIAGTLSLLGGLYIFLRAWKRRHCAFDRIMMGLSCHTMLWGIYHMWGTAAIPAGTPGVYGAKGTTVTCDIQGFLLQISMVVPFYYVFLSLYSWVVVLHGNFDPAKYEWIEKYIHVGVHIFPVASAIYLLMIEAFNSNDLHCWIASIPSGCGEENGIECTRGPQNPQLYLWIFGGVPAIFFLLFPTVVMVTLTYCVYLRQRKPEGQILSVIPASMVAKQSAIYLGSLYWVYVPLFVYSGFHNSGQEQSYWLSLLANLISTSMGIWFAIVYWYFSTEGFSGDDGGNKDKVGLDKTSNANSSNDNENYDDFATPTKANSRGRWSTRSSTTTRTVGSSNTMRPAMRPGRSSRRISRASSKRFSFNIFDGTASSGMFSAFVFEGDSEDEDLDAAESRKWEHCQEMNNDD